MAQPFDCLCGKPTCRGTIRGAKQMGEAQLAGTWLNGHIRELLDEQKHAMSRNTPAHAPGAVVPEKQEAGAGAGANGNTSRSNAITDPTVQALKEAVLHAEKSGRSCSHRPHVVPDSRSCQWPEAQRRRGWSSPRPWLRFWIITPILGHRLALSKGVLVAARRHAN